MYTRVLFLSALLLVSISLSTQAPAALLNWTLDSQQSYVRLNLPLNTGLTINGIAVNVRLRNPDNSNWSDAGGRASQIAGTFSTQLDVETSTLIYLPDSQSIHAVEFGSFRPNPAAFEPTATNTNNPGGQYTDTSGAPVAFALRINYNSLLFNVTAGFLALRDVSYATGGWIALSESDGALVGTGGTFGIESGFLDIDGNSVTVGNITEQYLVDTRGASLTGYGLLGQKTNTGTVSYRQFSPSIHQLEQLINIPLVFDIEGVQIAGSLTGRILAHAVPEPASSGLAIIALGLAVWRRPLTRASR
ncbi:MAG: PEP-CTERM sorting domain-containing protein [Pirellulaceae bacterium]|nr:PEP-CTERM sorting domain-containing protein [Pirellulaceae bacterium]